MGLPSNHLDCFNQPAFGPSQKPWGIAAPPQESKPLTQNTLNLALVSSVPFSLAPAAPVRFSAPEGLAASCRIWAALKHCLIGHPSFSRIPTLTSLD
ncbi:hypothetical protein PCANC_19682 [Puccinia coronata f. sp. avenae]|uniref:Uncharacterized protein n=1 Tax=Puccinia coronata f. sp. avenae TaxID=200324 RepID=A0A2N5SAX2_9BASI|nr:hypothetical protein PCANC_19682 [Puccinia coronata f. sp. avenae]